MARGSWILRQRPGHIYMYLEGEIKRLETVFEAVYLSVSVVVYGVLDGRPLPGTPRMVILSVKRLVTTNMFYVSPK